MAYPRITTKLLALKLEATNLTKMAFGGVEAAISPSITEALAAQMDLLNELIDGMQHEPGDEENPDNSV